MKQVAIMVDGAFLSIVFRKKNHRHIKPEDVLAISRKLIAIGEEIFRIYYYDAPPFNGKLVNPLNNSMTDYSQTTVFRKISAYHISLAEKEYVAFREGKISFSGWKLTDNGIGKIKRGQASIINAADIIPDFKQKAVDMKIGLDIAWLATKKIVDKIVLITADNDFIPPMKFARKEGLHVALADVENLNSSMLQHSDQVIPLDLTQIQSTS